MAEINDLNVTDASNTARFAENQAPSSLNDGARALEGILARWHKDNNGSLVSTGSSNAYALAANQTISAYYDGLTLTFEANFANTGAATLNVDSVGAQAIVWPDGTALEAGDIPSGAKVSVSYDSDNTQWMLLSSPNLGAMVKITSGTVSSAASLDLTDLSTTYLAYKLIFTDLLPATDGVGLWIRTSTDNGVSFDASNGNYQHSKIRFAIGGAVTGDGANSGTATRSQRIELGAATSGFGDVTSDEEIAGEITIIAPADSGQRTQVLWHISHENSSNNMTVETGTGQRDAQEANDAIRLLFSSGNIATMTYTLYGIRA